MLTNISNLLDEIRQYTKLHSELQQAHHFLFALFDPKHIRKSGDADYLVMGINPGEHLQDWKSAPCPPVHEESFQVDFHEQFREGRDAVKWTRTIKTFCNTEKYIQSEMFFWSSRDESELKKRYGKLRNSKHLKFCNDLNSKLIGLTLPRSIIVPGINKDKLMRKEFNLTHLGTTLDPLTGDRLCEKYTDNDRIWLFTKHWSGARGFTSNQRSIVKREIQAI